MNGSSEPTGKYSCHGRTRLENEMKPTGTMLENLNAKALPIMCNQQGCSTPAMTHVNRKSWCPDHIIAYARVEAERLTEVLRVAHLEATSWVTA